MSDEIMTKDKINFNIPAKGMAEFIDSWITLKKTKNIEEIRKDVEAYEHELEEAHDDGFASGQCSTLRRITEWVESGEHVNSLLNEDPIWNGIAKALAKALGRENELKKQKTGE